MQLNSQVSGYSNVKSIKCRGVYSIIQCKEGNFLFEIKSSWPILKKKIQKSHDKVGVRKNKKRQSAKWCAIVKNDTSHWSYSCKSWERTEVAFYFLDFEKVYFHLQSYCRRQ